MMENPWNQISELHFDKFPDTSGFQYWKSIFLKDSSMLLFRLPCCRNAVDQSRSGVAKSVDDLVTSRSISTSEGRIRQISRKKADCFEQLALVMQLLTYQIFSVFSSQGDYIQGLRHKMGRRPVNSK